MRNAVARFFCNLHSKILGDLCLGCGYSFRLAVPVALESRSFSPVLVLDLHLRPSLWKRGEIELRAEDVLGAILLSRRRFAADLARRCRWISILVVLKAELRQTISSRFPPVFIPRSLSRVLF